MSSREELINSYHGQKVLIDKISKGQFEKYNINEFLEYLKNITIFLEFPFAILMNDNKLLRYLYNLTKHDKKLENEFLEILRIAVKKLMFLESKYHINEFLPYFNINFENLKFEKIKMDDKEEFYYNIVQNLKNYDKIKQSFPSKHHDEMNINSMNVEIENADFDFSNLKKVQFQIFELKEDNFEEKLSQSKQYIYQFFSEKVNELTTAYMDLEDIKSFFQCNDINSNSNVDNEIKSVRNISKKVEKNKIDINNNDKSNKISIKDRKYFLLNEKLYQEEDLEIEFKNYHYPLNESLRKTLIKCINALLNQNGGRIFIGINDSRVVKGVRLTSKDKDIFKNELVNLTQNFSPPCRTNKIKVVYIPIMNNEKKMEAISNLYITKIMIAKGDDNTLYSIYKDNFTSYMRLEGQNVILNCEEIRQYIIERSKLENNPNNNIFTDVEPLKPGEYNIMNSVNEKVVKNDKFNNYEDDNLIKEKEYEEKSMFNQNRNLNFYYEDDKNIDFNNNIISREKEKEKSKNFNINQKDDLYSHLYDKNFNNDSNKNNLDSKYYNKSNINSSIDKSNFKQDFSNVSANSDGNNGLFACKVTNIPLDKKLDDLLVFIDREKIVKMKELRDGNGKSKFGFITFSDIDQLKTLNYCIEEYNIRYKKDIQLIQKV